MCRGTHVDDTLVYEGDRASDVVEYRQFRRRHPPQHHHVTVPGVRRHPNLSRDTDARLHKFGKLIVVMIMVMIIATIIVITIVITDHYHRHHDDGECIMTSMTMTLVGRINSHSVCIDLRQPCWSEGSHIGMMLATCSKNV